MADVRERYDVELTSVGTLGVSAMMHGYLAFDSAGELLTPFRTWRNTNTGEAAEQLSGEFGHNIRTAGAWHICSRPSSTTRSPTSYRRCFCGCYCCVRLSS